MATTTTTTTEDSAQIAFELAERLDAAADAIRKRSRQDFAAGRIGLDAYVDARVGELELRTQASMVVATGLGGFLEGTSAAVDGIEQAIEQATARIERVQAANQRLKIVAALVSLAGALAAGDPEAILRTGRAVAKLR